MSNQIKILCLIPKMHLKLQTVNLIINAKNKLEDQQIHMGSFSGSHKCLQNFVSVRVVYVEIFLRISENFDLLIT